MPLNWNEIRPRAARFAEEWKALDKAVDKAYRAKPFAPERERIEYLFELYQKLSAPLDVQTKPKKRKMN